MHGVFELPSSEGGRLPSKNKQREHKSMSSERAKNLRRMLAPRHVAFVGGRWAISALERCARFGFEGRMWLVNPRLPEIEVGEVFARIEDLPEGPDAIYLAVPSDKAIGAVRELAEHGSGGCICFAAGFAEKGGEGVAMEAELIQAAGDMALVGPNCYGFLDCRIGLHLWTGDLLERLNGPGIGIVSQSGALAEFLAMPRRSVPFASMVSVGNQAVVSLEEVAEALVEDDGINVIGIYIEGVKDIARFSRMAAKAAAKRKPVVVIKWVARKSRSKSPWVTPARLLARLSFMTRCSNASVW